MTKQPVWRPENALILAVVLIGLAIIAAVILLLSGTLQGGRTGATMPIALALVLGGGLAAYAILAYARKVRRQQRPEWLETQAWRQGLLDKLKESEARGSAKQQDPKER